MIALPTLILSVLGFLDSLFLSFVHLFGPKICLGASNSCNEVLLSSYSSIMGIPLSTLGLGIYCLLLFFSWRSRDLQKREDAFHWIFNISLLGTIVSGYLIYLQASVIQKWCPFCVGSAVIMALIFSLSTGYQLKKKRFPLFQLPQAKTLLKKVLCLLLLPSLIFIGGEFIKDRIVIEEVTIARIGEKIIKLDELDQNLGVGLYSLDMVRYNMRRQWFEDELLSMEAEKRGVSINELLSDLDKRTEVTENEVQKYFNEHRKRFPGAITENIKQSIIRSIRAKKSPIQKEEFIKELKKKYNASFSLPKPNPFTFEFNLGLGPEKGSPDAKIVIVEFSNITCHACARLQKRLDKLLKQYPQDIRIIFRHFPLNEAARLVHNVAACANLQGKFWLYLEKLFESRGQFAESKLYEYAEEIGLDIPELKVCLESEQVKKDIDRDVEEGKKLGIKGTPALFINGRFFKTPPSDYQLQKIIEEAILKK